MGIYAASHLPKAGNGKPSKKPNKPPIFDYVCSDCGSHEQVKRIQLSRATRPRCSKCGGPLNRPGQA